MGKCVIFGAADFDALTSPVDSEDLVIAADGGLVHSEKLGLSPDIIIGDFDSLGYIPTGAAVFPVEKDDTDTILALRAGLSRGFRTFHIYGAMDGKRLDHTVAAFQSLAFLCNHDARGYLIGADFMATVICNESVRFSDQASGILSVFCLGADATGVTLENLQYPLDGGRLTGDFPLGGSNHFIGKPCRIAVNSGKLLLIWDRRNGFPTCAE